jgi:hypothetical protein
MNCTPALRHDKLGMPGLPAVDQPEGDASEVQQTVEVCDH